MAFVNLVVETQKAVFEAGTVAGNWKFWVIDPDGDIIAGPQETPNESIVFFVDDSSPTKDQVFTAYVVRVDADGADLGPIAESPFTLSEDLFVVLKVAGGINAEQPSPPSGPPSGGTIPEGGAGFPSNELPGGPPNRPSTGPVRPPRRPPNQTLPEGGGPRPGNELPGEQPGIDNTLPGGVPPTPGNELPETPEPK